MQFAQDELRDDECAFEESGFGNVADTAVNDGAGIENLGVGFAGSLRGEDSAEGGEVQHVAFVGAHYEADVGHEQENDDLQQAAGAAIGKAVAQHETEEKGPDDTKEAADDSTKKAPKRQSADAQLEEDDESGNDGANAASRPRIEAEGAKKPAGNRENQDEEQTQSE